MRRSALLFALIAVVAVPNAVQVQTGWKMRIDGSHGVSAPDVTPTLKIAPTGKGLHIAGGPGAITIHVYSPPIRSIGHYEIEDGELQRRPTPPDEPSASSPALLAMRA